MGRLSRSFVVGAEFPSGPAPLPPPAAAAFPASAGQDESNYNAATRSPAHFEFFADVERVVERAIDDVENAARARHADGFALLETVDRRNARFAARQAAEDVDDFPPEFFLPELPQAGKSRLERFRAFGHAPSPHQTGAPVAMGNDR
jgi:hypothetical protein